MPRVATASALRVLAHPLRSRLLAALRVHGRATATELAEALGTHTGATSYHLRKLEEVGLVVDAGTGTGRRRVWQAVDEARPGAFDDEPMDEDDAEAADWLARDYLSHFGDRAQAWLSDRHTWAPAWQEQCGLEDHTVQVTTEQLTALRAELLEVLDRYRRVGQGNPQAKRVVVYTCALPVDEGAGTSRAAGQLARTAPPTAADGRGSPRPGATSADRRAAPGPS